ncbi:beta-galactosidase [Pedobacter jejuensis]|nr:beta-galactosidase [Pedobacter jejuensis]
MMKCGRSLLLLLLGLSAFMFTNAQEVVNDHMFHELPEAKNYSDFDSKGFLINRKRTFIVSAGMEYARVPHQLWRERLLQLKRGGFNCIEIYTIWNYHEPLEGKFEFDGDKNLDQFLALIKELGLYSIVRVGPYYCAEWDQGGYPTWLRFKPGLRVREDNAEFKKYVDRFFDRLLPIVMKHQITKGGSVILIQLENEHPKGWGTDMPNDYFKHLQSKSLAMGMEIPYFFSGLHHATDPAGKGKLDDPKRPNPWFSTEFWSVWYSQYGAKPTDAPLYDRRTWKIIAHGGNGYNFYMAHGGSNFGYTNNDEDAASYDYGAAVGQAGDLRPLYFTFKRAGYFARSFQEILENSTDASAAYQYLTNDTSLHINARKSDAGTLIFLDNPAEKQLTKTITVKGLPSFTINLLPGELYPIVHQFKLNDKVELNWGLSRIFGVVKQQNTTTILVEANAGDPIYLNLITTVKAIVRSTVNSGDLKVSGKNVTLNTVFTPSEQSSLYLFKAGDQLIRIVVLDKAATNKTWITSETGKEAIVTGVSYLGEAKLSSTSFQAAASYPLTGAKDTQAMLYLEDGLKKMTVLPIEDIKTDSLLHLTPWENKDAAIFSSSKIQNGKWLASENPLQMGMDGNLTNSAWYRTKFNAPSAGKYTLQSEGGDRATVFVDGKLVTNWKIRNGELTLVLEKGMHNLAFFTAHDGRDKLAAYLGPITEIDKKGLSGVTRIKKGGPFISTLDKWYFTAAADSMAIKSGPPLLDTIKTPQYKIGADAFGLKAGYGWFQTIIKAQPGLPSLTISFKSTDENATLFINGKKVLRHEGWNIPFEYKITDAAILAHPIELSVFIENLSNEGGIDQPVKINTMAGGTVLNGWNMKNGVDPEDATVEWKNLMNTDSLNGPQWYRSTFNQQKIANRKLVWRVHPYGLGHGSVWINGHNLGRYPEKIGDVGMYIPEPWLKEGLNEIVIYDEDGKTPGRVKIMMETASSKITYNLKTEDIK